MRKLILDEDLKKDLYKMREILENVAIDKSDLSSISAGGCGGTCNVTCSYWCESYCAGSCKGIGEMGCAYKQVCPGQPWGFEGQ